MSFSFLGFLDCMASYVNEYAAWLAQCRYVHVLLLFIFLVFRLRLGFSRFLVL